MPDTHDAQSGLLFLLKTVLCLQAAYSVYGFVGGMVYSVFGNELKVL